MPSRPLLTTQEISALLKVKEPTAGGWIHDGRLRAIKLSREFRLVATDL